MNKFYQCFYNNDKDSVIRTDASDNFCVNYDYKVPTVGIHEALLETVSQLIYKAKAVNRVPCIFYSGGIDSEIILNAFLELGYKSGEDFHCIHAVYDINQNKFDTVFVDEFVNKNNLNIELVHLETIKWYRSQECFNYCIKHNLSYVTMSQMTRLMEMMYNKNYYPIIGHGDPQIYRYQGIVYHSDYEFQNSWNKFLMINNMDGCSNFFRETGNLYINYVHDFAKNIDPNTEYNELDFWNFNSPTLKYKVFHFYEMIKRDKFTGHEEYRTEEINQINLQLQAHTKYTFANKLIKNIESFTNNYFSYGH